MTSSEEILATFHTFWEIWAQRRRQDRTLDELAAFFDPDVTAIGTGEHEQGRTFDQVLQNFRDDLNEVTVPLQLDLHYERARELSSTVGLVEAEAQVRIDMAAGEQVAFHIRFTTLFTKKGGRWLVSHNHVSIPFDGQSHGEAYPIDELKAKNERLQREVAERTKKIEEKTLQLQAEKEKTERLLYNILPEVVARELLATGKTRPARFENASVLFTDFVQFTKVASAIPADRLVDELNEIFYVFDDIVKSKNLEKIKTIGDSYMAACGLPVANERHALHCVEAAGEMIRFLQERSERGNIRWKMRVGIHSGPVVAGVVGNHKFTYDLWGHTVNLASRLESTGEEGKINISGATYALVRDFVACGYRGRMKVKGMDEVEMYFIR